MNSIKRRHPELAPATPHKLRHTAATLAKKAGRGLLTRFQKHLHIVTSQSQRHISIPKALLSKQLVKQPSESSKRTKGNFRESFDFRAKKDTQDKNLECLETLI